jgi:pyruvate/2-oxoglutarate dehydrogenase complex dihydrolipoamide acyltransferase (E2) component
VDEVWEAIKLGFHSLMYDGAHLPFEENIKTTRHVVQVAHTFGIPVEAELGKIPDADEEVDWQSYYTDVAEAERFVKETGVDWLAISVGIVHGVPTATPQPLDIQRIRDIRDATGIPLVLHGASGVPDDEIREATAAGVAKFNADTDLRHAFRAGIEEDVGPGRPPAGGGARRGARPDDRRDGREAGAVRLRGPVVEGAGMTTTEAPAGTTTPLKGMRKVAARRMVEAWAIPVFTPHRRGGHDPRARHAGAHAREPRSPTPCSRRARPRCRPTRRSTRTATGAAVTVFDEVNLGIAVATDAGLTVPVLAGAQALDLSGLAAARRDVVERARTGKLTRADLTGGTFTVSNLGMMGIDRFDAILNPPQVAILAVGSTKQRQVWNDGDPAWRPIAELTLTCDHRAVDGAAGAGFLATLREHLQA